MKTMCKLQFPNGEIISTHIWNNLVLNKCLKNN